MRVAIVADTHGFIDPRVVEAVVGCDLVVHAGDVGAAQVLTDLRGACSEVIAVSGNNDVPAKWRGARTVLRRLPPEARIELPGGELCVVHGHRVLPAGRRHERLRLAYADARVVVYGHSHHRVVDRDRRPWIVNPGAAGKSRTFGGPSLCFLQVAGRRWTIRERVFVPAP